MARSATSTGGWQRRDLVARARAGRRVTLVRARIYGLTRGVGEIAANGADLRSYVVGKNSIGIWRWLPTAVVTNPEKELFPGVIAVVFAAIAMAGEARHPRLRQWIVLYSLVAAAAVVLSLGPRISVWGIVLTSNGPCNWLLRIVPGMDGIASGAIRDCRSRGAVDLPVVRRGARAPARRTSVAADRDRRCHGGDRRGLGRAVAVAALTAEGRRRIARSPPGCAARPALPHLPRDRRRSRISTISTRRSCGHPIVNGYSGYAMPLLGSSRVLLTAVRPTDFLRWSACFARSASLRSDSPDDYRQDERRVVERTLGGSAVPDKRYAKRGCST
jgi:hypothetical protein